MTSFVALQRCFIMKEPTIAFVVVTTPEVCPGRLSARPWRPLWGSGGSATPWCRLGRSRPLWHASQAHTSDPPFPHGPFNKRSVKFMIDKDFDVRITFHKFNVRGCFRAIVTGELLVRGFFILLRFCLDYRQHVNYKPPNDFDEC